MTEWWIARESTQALNLFRWVNKILEYIGVALKLKELGMQEIEKRRIDVLKRRDLNQRCVESKKMFKRVKVCLAL
jgi:hypothetical protein